MYITYIIERSKLSTQLLLRPVVSHISSENFYVYRGDENTHITLKKNKFASKDDFSVVGCHVLRALKVNKIPFFTL